MINNYVSLSSRIGATSSRTKTK